jgi:menaquinone-dependent protoporphyrinogen IX oxidase
LRIERMQEETRKFAAEQRKIGREIALAPWQPVVTAMIAGAAPFGAGAAL